MAFESPLFQSSMELLGHSIEHFVSLEELDRKLVILHLANSVELILKDLMLDGGVSIFKNPKETVTIHGAIEALKMLNVNVPCLNKIELLIDERNALQHRYGSPNELTTIYYMDSTISFFEQILLHHYNLKLDELLPQFTKDTALASFNLRQPSNETELEKLNNLALLHPLGALLSANAYLERVLHEYLRKADFPDDSARRRFTLMPMSYRVVERFGLELPSDLKILLEEVRKTRNLATHGKTTVDKEDVRKAVKAIEEFERLVRDHEPKMDEFIRSRHSVVESPIQVSIVAESSQSG